MKRRRAERLANSIQQIAVEVSSQVAVMELNARVLEEVVGLASTTAAFGVAALFLMRRQLRIR